MLKVELAPRETAPPATRIELNPEALISQAIEKGLPVETMERLLAMRTQLKDERAKEEFDADMAAFQGECPTIAKTKEVKTNGGQVAYRYAPIESIVSQVKSLLGKYGFSYAVKTETAEVGVKAICIVKHRAGHSEQSEFSVPLGTKTNMMNASQVVAAALTFAKRYAFLNAFGIMTGDEDTDGKTDHVEKESVPVENVDYSISPSSGKPWKTFADEKLIGMWTKNHVNPSLAGYTQCIAAELTSRGYHVVKGEGWKRTITAATAKDIQTADGDPYDGATDDDPGNGGTIPESAPIPFALDGTK